MLIKLRSKKNKGFTLVELMIVVAIIGILAAIAIPAFLRYIKSSKAAEAEGIMKKMTDGAKSYFTSEQKFSASAASGGSEPWHTAGTGTSAAGFPVPFNSYVFPGGATVAAFDTAGGTAAPACGTNTPQGGSKMVPFATAAPTGALLATLNKLNFATEDPNYFLYGYSNAGTGTAATATVVAMADFDSDGMDCHTSTITVAIDADTQEVQIGPSVLTNEFD